jgi:hypothetical protein
MARIGEARFYKFVREERLFCMILAHILLEQPSNLSTFVETINERLHTGETLCSTPTKEALLGSEVYFEFSYLRDHWFALGKNNNAKRARILALLSKVLQNYQSDPFPKSRADFNAYFLGKERGSRISRDIVYPGQWNVLALHDKFKDSPEEFRAFCRFKWAFNIKPDLVLLIPGCRPICVEAKLESKEDRYPRDPQECKVFDTLFGPKKGRVRQVELQQFMFEHLLDERCQSVVLSKKRGDLAPPTVSLTWGDVFKRLETQRSHPFVGRLLTSNIYLHSVRSPKDRQD